MQKQSQSFLKMAGTLALSGVMLLGPTSAALADSSIGANISTSAGGTITSAGLLTASLGFISTGAAVNLNASSNFAVNIATGTSTGTVTIGNSLADVAIVDPQWSITGAGAAAFASVSGNGSGLTNIADGALSAAVAHLDVAETISANWVNTANPWADNEVSDTLTASLFVGSGSTTTAIDLATAEVAGILAGGNGGTGNAFFQVTGPTTTIKTFTFPDASGTVCVTSTCLSSVLTDNVTNALDIQQGTDNYININTTNSSENISFGNATTNPSFSFLGSGSVNMNSHLVLGPATSHIRSTQTTAPVVTDGGTPSLAAGSTDTAGRIIADASASGATITLTFNTTYTTPPACVIAPANAGAATILASTYVDSTATVMTINNAELTGTEWMYICIGH